MTIVSGRHFALLSLLVLSFATIYSVLRARRSTRPIGIRRIAGLEALEEIVGRATETGRPIHFTTGLGAIESGDLTARVLGGLELMAWVTRRVVNYGAKMIVSVCRPSTFAVTREVLRNAYAQEDKTEEFQETMVRFLSETQFAFATGAASIMEEEKVSGNIMVGAFGAESLLLAEMGNAIGAVQVAGDTNMFQIPFFVVSCDYTLIGEEMFAVGAVLGNNRDSLGSLQAQDLGKALALLLLILGALLATAKNPFLSNLIKW